MLLLPASHLEWYVNYNSKIEERAGEIARWVQAMAPVWTKTALSASTWWLSLYDFSFMGSGAYFRYLHRYQAHVVKTNRRTNGSSKHACYQAYDLSLSRQSTWRKERANFHKLSFYVHVPVMTCMIIQHTQNK